MGGNISCESEFQKGSKFIVENLKFETASPTELEKVDTENLGNAVWKIENPGDVKIVVEDNKINQMVIQKMLSSYGYRITIANNGEEAIQIWKNSNNSFFINFYGFENAS